jgi:threonine dehydrogenase-like Zn-dependent dehydrogenase
MRATLMYGAGDVRVEDVPDARLIESTDALVRVTRAAICGSDLWCLTEAELKEVIIHLAFYAGCPKAMSAVQVAKRAFES